MKPSKTGGVRYSDTVSSFLQKVKHDTSSTPRMLTLSEQRSLRLHVKETGAQARAIARRQGLNNKVGKSNRPSGKLASKKH